MPTGTDFVASKEQRQTAIMLYGLGASDEQVAKHMGCAKSTVQKHFADEKVEGWEWANLQLYSRLWRKAMEGNIAALIFLAKNRLGMDDRPNSGDGGSAALAPPPNEELCVTVRYVFPDDPRAFPPPPIELLPEPQPASA